MPCLGVCREGVQSEQRAQRGLIRQPLLPTDSARLAGARRKVVCFAYLAPQAAVLCSPVQAELVKPLSAPAARHQVGSGGCPHRALGLRCRLQMALTVYESRQTGPAC